MVYNAAASLPVNVITSARAEPFYCCETFALKTKVSFQEDAAGCQDMHQGHGHVKI